MNREELILKLLIKIDEGFIYNFDVFKDKIVIYGTDLMFCSIKLNNKILEQYNQIFK